MTFYVDVSDVEVERDLSVREAFGVTLLERVNRKRGAYGRGPHLQAGAITSEYLLGTCPHVPVM